MIAIKNPADGRGVHSFGDGLPVHYSEFDALPQGEYRRPCVDPVCRDGRRKDTALGVKVDHKGWVAHCFRCGGIWNGGRKVGTSTPPPPPPPAKRRRTSLSDWGRRIWNECQPISGTAAAYLQARRCVIPPQDGHLRWHPQLKHSPSGYVGPALVGLITDAATGKALSLHRTWIKADGTKATDPDKMMLAGHAIAGGVIRLWPDDAVTYGLAVAEGIETALTLAHAYTPAWALIDAGHLSQFKVLAGVETLVIARDNDPKGIAAAYECSATWTAAGVEVFVTDQEENDINDVAQEVDA